MVFSKKSIYLIDFGWESYEEMEYPFDEPRDQFALCDVYSPRDTT